jgi:hypothetical protein
MQVFHISHPDTIIGLQFIFGRVMKETKVEGRSSLVRESLIFQLKLIVDGFRDFALVPVSLVATLVGLVRGGDEPDREFRQVLELGRQTEHWINLFGQHTPIEEAGNAGSMDLLLTRAEEVVREQSREGGISEAASRAINRALSAAHDKARESTTASKKDSKERGVDI